MQRGVGHPLVNPSVATPPDPSNPFQRPWATWLALALLTLLVAGKFAPTWRAGIDSVVPALSVFGDRTQLSPQQKMWNVTTRADTTFAAWLVSRNAYTLLHRPTSLFHGEHCAPTENSLTLGEPMITLGLLAVPAYLVTGDPIVTYNLAMFTVWWLGAVAIFSLVVAWTGNPVAGFLAAVIYTFHPAHARDITHPFIYDMAWTTFALLFSQRLLARGRWRDAVGLSVCLVLQMGASFYPLLSALFLVLPFSVWLVVTYGLRQVTLAQFGFVLACAGLGAFAIYSPYLELRAGSDLLERANHNYSPWVTFLPGGLRFPGWPPLLLIVAGLVLGRRELRGRLGGDPRGALVLGALLVALAATGGTEVAERAALFGAPPPPVPLPNLYRALASWLPGLDAIRNVSQLGLGVHLAASVLAGLGAASLWRRVQGRRMAVAVALVAAAAVSIEAVRPIGTPPKTHWDQLEIRPGPDAIDFYAQLDQLGNTGAMLEVPIAANVMYSFGRALNQILLSAWHHRPTSACFGSYKPPEQERVVALARLLPDAEAVRELAALGFTTIVAHEIRGGELRRGLEALVQTDRLRRVHATPRRAAYGIAPSP